MRTALVMLLALVATACALPSPPFELQFEEAATVEQRQTVERAAERWNAELGRRAFYLPGEVGGLETVRVQFRPRSSALMGQATAHKGGDYYVVTLRTDPSESTAAHELGHTLGLADCDDVSAVMHRLELPTAVAIRAVDVDEVRTLWGW